MTFQIGAKRCVCAVLLVIVLLLLALVIGAGCTSKFCPAYDKKYYPASSGVSNCNYINELVVATNRNC